MGSRLVRLQGEGVSVLFPLSTPLGFPKFPDSREGIHGSKKQQDRGPALGKDQTSTCSIISRAVESLANCQTSAETPGKETVARKTDFSSSFRGGNSRQIRLLTSSPCEGRTIGPGISTHSLIHSVLTPTLGGED